MGRIIELLSGYKGFYIVGEKVLVLTVGTLTSILQNGLLRLLDNNGLEASVIDQGTTTGWVSVLKQESKSFILIPEMSG